MIAIYSFLAQVSNVLPIEEVGKGEEEAPVSGSGALAWAVLLILLVLMVLMGLKNSKRTHLD
jgi:hypothetical protein